MYTVYSDPEMKDESPPAITVNGHVNNSLEVLDDTDSSHHALYTRSEAHLHVSDTDSNDEHTEKSFVDNFKLTLRQKLSVEEGSAEEGSAEEMGMSIITDVMSLGRQIQDYPDHSEVDIILVSRHDFHFHFLFIFL